MAEFLLDVQGPSATPASGTSLLFPHSSNKLWAQKDDAGKVITLAGIRNNSIADQVVSAADNYLTGSALAVPAHLLQVGARLRWTIWMTKSAASTATPIWNVRVGTGGVVGDTARLTFTSVAQTAAADTGRVDIEVLVRSFGAAGVITGCLQLSHNLAATGFANLSSPTLVATSAGFDMTVANLIVGISVNPGTAGVFTHQGVYGELVGV